MKLALLLSFCAAAWAQTFDESRPDRLRISSPAYDVDFSKTNGAILAITDRRAQANLTRSSRSNCLWTVDGNCTSDSFRYQWSGGRLRLRYGSRVTVTVIPRRDFFDLQIAADTAAIQTGLVFDIARLDAAYL